MRLLSKSFSLLLLILLAASSIMIVKPANAQSIPKPSIPEFTVKIVDHSYDVPASVTSTIDPYNNKTITRTFPAYHVQNITVEITVKNQPFPATIQGNTSFLYYNLRYKPHFGQNWYNVTTQNGNVTPQSNSQYIVLYSYPVYDFKTGDQIDFQVEVTLGYHYTTYEYLEHLPSYYHGPYPVPVDHIVYVETSGWSPTQTFIMPNISPTPMPFQSNEGLILPIAVVVLAMIIVFFSLLYRRHRNTSKSSQ